MKFVCSLLLLLVVSSSVIAQNAVAPAGRPSTQGPATTQRRVAPPAADLLDVFVEIPAMTDPVLFAGYDKPNNIRVDAGAVFTLKKPGKSGAGEARARSPQLLGERWRAGTLPVATWTSPASVRRVDFFVGGQSTQSAMPAEIYKSPAVLAGGCPQCLDQIANFISGFGLPVTVRVIYEDGQVWIASFVLRERGK